MSSDEGRQESLPPSQSPEPVERNLPSTSEDRTAKARERQEQWLEQSQEDS